MDDEIETVGSEVETTEIPIVMSTEKPNEEAIEEPISSENNCMLLNLCIYFQINKVNVK